MKLYLQASHMSTVCTWSLRRRLRILTMDINIDALCLANIDDLDNSSIHNVLRAVTVRADRNSSYL